MVFQAVFLWFDLNKKGMVLQMTNSTRYFLSHLTTRLGLAAVYSSMHLRPAGCEMPQEQKRVPAACVSSTHLKAAQGFLSGKTAGWRSAGKGVSEMTFAFPECTRVNTLVLREAGSHIRHFALECWQDGGWVRFYESDKVERYRYCSFPAQESVKYRLLILETWGAARLTECSFYCLAKQTRETPFRVSAYMRFDTEQFLSMTQEERDVFSQHFETVNEVILFDTLKWSKDGAVWFNYRDETQTNEEAKQAWLASAADARAVIEKSGGPVKVLASFFQPGEGTVESLENHMEQLTDALLAFLQEAGLDGIEFDWEFPKGKKEWALFSRFLVLLKEKLAPAQKILAVALADWGVHLSPEAVRAIDQLSYMAYDIIDLNGYHSSFGRAAVRAVEYAEKCGFRREQINLGLPYYGRPTYKGEYWPSWDDAKVGYWQNYDPHIVYNGIEMDAYYNCPGMVADKTAFALQMGLGGMMIFPLNADRPKGHEMCLTDAIRRTLEDRVEPDA